MERISVAIRVKPSSNDELVKGNHWVIDQNMITLCNCYGAPISGYTYAFDRLFGPNSMNSDVYNIHAKDVVISAMQGFNGTVFAYGQTSSGKTFTMQGTEDQPGLIRLAIRDVFNSITKNPDREFLVRVSYMEIYNEEINDLLAPENRKLQIHENFERGLFVAGLREEIVNGPEQVLDFLMLGEAHRHFGETNMNVYSSRSHTIFRMVIESRDKDRNSDAVRVSTLNMVDLAGSERVAKTGAGGVRLKEGTHINKSLMTLGNVIHKLSEGVKGHIPYRDSKLTRILQSALDGNAKTAIICTITPDEIHVDESRGTLLFASRAKKVATCAHVNEILTDAALLKRQKREIEELREKLQGLKSDEFEQQLLKLRNDLLKYELEKEKLALELEEERKVHAKRELRIKEQEKKIQNLSSLFLTADKDDQINSNSIRRETWSPLPNAPQDCRSPLSRITLISTRRDKDRMLTPPPAFDALIGKDGDLRTPPRAQHTDSDDNTWRDLNKENIADEDTWNRLNNPQNNEWSTGKPFPAFAFTPCVKSNEVELLDFQLKELQVQFDDLQCSFDTKNEEANDMKERFTLLSEKFDKTTEELENLRRENAVLRETNKELDARKSVKEQQATDDKLHLRSLMSRIEELNSHIAHMEKQNALAELEIARENELVLEQELVELNEQLHGLREENDRSNKDLKAITAVNVTLREDNRRITALLEESQMKQEEAASECANLFTQNLEVTTLSKELEEAYMNLKKDTSLQGKNAKEDYQKLLVVTIQLKRQSDKMRLSLDRVRSMEWETKQQLCDFFARYIFLDELHSTKDAELRALLTRLSSIEKKYQDDQLEMTERASLGEELHSLKMERDHVVRINKSKDAELHALQTKLSILEKNREDDHDALSSSTSRISYLEELLRTEVDRLSSINKSKDDELQESLTRLSSLEMKYQNQLKLSTEHETELKGLKAEKGDLSSISRSKDNEIHALEAKLTAMEEKNTEERIALMGRHNAANAALLQELDGLKAENDNLSGHNESKENAIHALETRLQALEKEHNDERMALTEKHDVSNAALLQELNGLRVEICALETRLEAVEKKYNDELTALAEKHDVSNAALLQELNGLKAEKEKLSGLNKSKEENIGGLEDRLESLEEKYNEERVTLMERHEVSNAALLQELNGLKAEKENLSGLNKRKEDKIGGLEDRLKSLEEKYNEERVTLMERLEVSNATLLQELNGMKTERDNLSRLNESKESEIRALDTKLEIVEKEYNDERMILTERNVALLQELNQLKTERGNLSRVNESKENEIHELETRLTASEKKYNDERIALIERHNVAVAELAQGLDKLKAEKEYLSSLNDSKENEIHALETKNTAIEKKYNDGTADLIEKHTVACAALAHDLNALRTANEHLSSLNESKENEIHALETKLATTEKKYNEELIAMMEKHNAASATLMNELKAQKDNLSDVNESKENEIHELETKLAAADKKYIDERADLIEKHTVASSALARELSALRVENERLSSLNEGKEQKLHALETKLAATEKKCEEERIALIDKLNAATAELLNDLKVEREHLSSLSESKENDIHALESKLTVMEKRNDEERINLIDQHTVARAALAQELRELGVDKERLSALCESKDQELQASLIRISALETKLDEQTKTLESLSRFKALASKLEGEVDSLRAERDRLSEAIAAKAVENKEVIIDMYEQRKQIAQELRHYMDVISCEQEKIAVVCSGINTVIKPITL